MTHPNNGDIGFSSVRMSILVSGQWSIVKYRSSSLSLWRGLLISQGTVGRKSWTTYKYFYLTNQNMSWA
ncbi:MAG: hypothetical protein HC862_04225 [Scytonema sp. RU_4_4]|nr:hypothetical protein [Scytonema sp. RU_4_4]